MGLLLSYERHPTLTDEMGDREETESLSDRFQELIGEDWCNWDLGNAKGVLLSLLTTAYRSRYGDEYFL